MPSYLLCGQIQSRLLGKTSDFLSKLRLVLPNVEIVASTWAGEVQKEHFGYIDNLILNDDPGESVYGRNWSRILKSTQEGINAASQSLLIRSRVEVGITNAHKFSKLMNEARSHVDKIMFPANVTQYQFEKGLLFAMPDFFHIGSKAKLQEYWDSNHVPSKQKKFHMTTNYRNSLSSDQVLALNFCNTRSEIPYFKNKYKSNKGLWRKFQLMQQQEFAFFNELNYGITFGRLARTGKNQELYDGILNSSQLNILDDSLLKFRFGQVTKRSKRTLYHLLNTIKNNA